VFGQEVPPRESISSTTPASRHHAAERLGDGLGFRRDLVQRSPDQCAADRSAAGKLPRQRGDVGLAPLHGLCDKSTYAVHAVDLATRQRP